MNNKRENIWLFHHYATPPNMNGFTRPYEFGIHLQKDAYKLKVFSASHLHFSETNLIDDNTLFISNNDTDVPFIFVKTSSSSGNGVKRILNMFSYYRNLLKVAKKFIKEGEKPELIIASSPHPLAMLAGIKLAKKMKIPCICEVRDFWPEVFFMGGKLKENSFIGKVLVKGEYWIYKNADALIFLKEGDYRYITDKKWDIDQGGSINLNKCHYINNGVNFEEFNRLMDEEIVKDPDLENEKFKVVYTGAIRPVNDIGNILDAAKVLKNNKDIQFLIYGDGNQLDSLKKRIENEKITNVKMKGYIEKKYIPYILSKSSVNILNYSQNKYNWSRGNSSNKLFEYMASGTPIISTVKMGYSPIAKYDCGFSLEENTPENLAQSIMKTYKLSAKRYEEISNNAKQGALDFNYEKLTQRLINVIESLEL